MNQTFTLKCSAVRDFCTATFCRKLKHYKCWLSSQNSTIAQVQMDTGSVTGNTTYTILKSVSLLLHIKNIISISVSQV